MSKFPDMSEHGQLLESADTALSLLSPAHEPQQRVHRESLRVRDNLFSIVADAYPYLSKRQQAVADWLYDMHLTALAERGLRPCMNESS